MQITRTQARLTAGLFLLMGLPGVPSLAYLPRAFIVPGDAAATAQRITNAAPLYRAIVLGDLISAIGFILLAWWFYRLFEEVDRKQARLLVMFVLVAVGLSVLDVMLLVTPLVLQSGAAYLSPFGKAQLDSLTLGTFSLRDALLQVAESFWGLWLLPLGVLVIKSGVIPKFIGVLLIIECFAWLTLSFSSIALPEAHLVHRVAFLFTQPGEPVFLLWFIVKSITLKPASARVAFARSGA